MKVEIVAVNDENFTLGSSFVPCRAECGCKCLEDCKQIGVMKMGDVFVTCDGHCSCIGKCEKDAVEGLTNMLESNTKVEVLVEEPTPQEKPAVPLENPKETNSFDWFSGTSFSGKKQLFD